MEWQPIETAPKGGKDVLLAYNTRQLFTDAAVMVRQGYFDDDKGWVTLNGALLYGDFAPTHWMPMPAPPSNLNSTTPQCRVNGD